MFQLIDRKSEILLKKADLFKKLFNTRIPKYILGINYLCDSLIKVFNKKNINLTGIIDDFTDLCLYQGVKVYKLSDIEKDSLVISCVVDGKLITAIDNIKNQGVHHILSYFDLCLYDNTLFVEPNFLQKSFIDIENNLKKYHWLYEILEDRESKETLIRLLDFRYNYNIETMRNFNFNVSSQYFDKIITFQKKEVFVDCGGFEGETTKEFIIRNPQYHRIFYFEPSPTNFQKSLENLAKYERINFYNYATFNESTYLLFDTSKGSASSFSNEGNVLVKTERLDDIIDEKVTYIKLDVEGAEYETLIGAEKLIKTYKPKIAVCIYHNQADFWRIPELVLGYNPNYRVVMRHYTEGILETVMYFL